MLDVAAGNRGLASGPRCVAATRCVGVIAWELGAQAGVNRPIQKTSPFVAGTILDYFDVRLKPGVTPLSI